MPYLAYQQENGYLFPPYLDELIAVDHVARVVNEVVNLLDIRELTSQMKVEGRPAYHPRMMLKILFYAYSQKVRSSREIARRCCEDVVFMWLAGMQRPDFRTISDFRKDNIEVLRRLFKQVVQICQRLGMVSLGLVAIDGTKVKAQASDYGARTHDALKEALKAVEEDIEKYMAESAAIDEAEDILYGKAKTGQELPKKVRKALERKEALVAAIKQIEAIKEADRTGNKEPKVNPQERDAQFMKHCGGRIQLSYNCQAAVDEKKGVIVAEGVTTEANDKRQMLPMLRAVEETTERKPDKAAMDPGYHSKKNLEEAEKMGIDCYVGSRRGEVEEGVRGKAVEVEVHSFASTESGQSAMDTASTLVAVRQESNNANAVERMSAKLQSEEGKKVYGKRKEIVEPVFGQVKSNLGFVRFLLRGLKKVSGEWALICLVHNIRRIYAYLKAEGEGGLTQRLEMVYAS
jgi:transposase